MAFQINTPALLSRPRPKVLRLSMLGVSLAGLLVGTSACGSSPFCWDTYTCQPTDAGSATANLQPLDGSVSETSPSSSQSSAETEGSSSTAEGSSSTSAAGSASEEPFGPDAGTSADIDASMPPGVTPTTSGSEVVPPLETSSTAVPEGSASASGSSAEPLPTIDLPEPDPRSDLWDVAVWDESKWGP